MKPSKLVLAILACALPLAPVSKAQSLGEFARQQREKQKEAKKAAKVYTNENMPARPPEEGATAAAGISSPPATEVSAKPESAPGATEPGTAKPTTESKLQETPPATKEEKPEDKIKTADYWQAKFKAAREPLAGAKEEQQLAQDELQLLQIQQAREISAQAQTELASKIAAKKEELDAKRAAAEKAEKALQDLEKEFKDSGAPEEWIHTE